MATWALAFFAVLLLVVPLPAGRASSPSLPPGFQPSPNANFSVEGPGPETTLPAGSILTVQYELQDPSYQSTQKGLYVRVPAPTAQFNVSYGQLRIQMPGLTVGLNSTNWTNPANTTTNQQLLNETIFPNTGRVANDRAALSTGELALTSPEPYGALTVDLRWRWAASPSFGANFTGSWEPSPAGIAIEPDQFVQLLTPLTEAASPGQNLVVCLGGPVAARTFSLHGIQPSPRLDFTSVNVTVPRNGTTPFCLSLYLATWLEPQSINVYVWDYNQTTNQTGNLTVTSFLLYVIKVNVVATNPPPAVYYGVPLTDWYWGLGGAAAVLLVVGGVFLFRRRSRPPRTPPQRAPSPSAAPPNGASAPPHAEGDGPPGPSNVPIPVIAPPAPAGLTVGADRGTMGFRANRLMLRADGARQ